MNDHDDNQPPRKKHYETEWRFSIDNVGEAVSGILNKVGVGADQDIKNAYYVDAVEDAETLSVTIEPTIGEATIRPLHDSDNLIEARVCYIGKTRFMVETEDTHKRIVLNQVNQHSVKNAIGSITRQGELFWDVSLTPNLPIDLLINSGMTRNHFDLRDLQLHSLKLNTGTGKTELLLPTMGQRYPAVINSGTGELNIHSERGADFTLKAAIGTGRISAYLQENTHADIAISGGVGSCTVYVPKGAAVRLHAANGIGRVSVPDWMERGTVTNFIATSGTWESANYETAEQRITIKYEGGVGTFTLAELPN